MKKLLLVLAVLCFARLNSQDFLGLQSSNYAGVNGAISNPANIVDNRFVVDIALVGLHATIDNNYMGLRRGAGLTNFNWKKRDSSIIVLNNGKPKAFFVSNRLVLPSFLITLNRKNAIAFNWSVRNYINVDGVSQDLANLLFNDLSIPTLLNKRLTNKNLSIQQMSWAEYGLSYARVVKLDGPHFFKAGLTVKLLQGLEAAYFYVRNLDYLVSTKDTLSFFKTEVAYGHSDNLNFSGNNPSSVYKFTSSPGFGLDIGAVYEWRPNFNLFQYEMDGVSGLYRRDKNKYKLKASLAINDIGGIRFKKGALSNDFVADVTRFNIGVFQQADNITEFDSTIKAHPNEFQAKADKRHFTMRLPMSINAQVDYNIWKPFYVNLTANFSNFFKNRESKVYDYTTISITPRVEDKWFGLGIPLSYNSLSGRRGDYLHAGAMLRMGPLVLGSNNVLNYVTGDIFGANFYFLLKIPIPYGIKKDSDHDGISNKKDKCRNVPGVWEFMGCPDKDGDHVPDSDDRCPDVAGLKQLLGCPDRDSDGIADKDDMCPDTAGTSEFKGCPDSDGDKIIDKEDDCPEEPGLITLKGCPDKDGDGVKDKIDLCPEQPGPASNEGCPEKILHLIDAQGNTLRTVIGNKDNSFRFDELPADEFVIFKLEGIGTDSLSEIKIIVGGIAKKALRDNKDKYFRFIVLRTDVNKMGRENEKDIAIKLNKQEAEVLKKAFNNLEFATAKDIIKEESFASLNELAGLMARKPNWRLKISGHTDNLGKAATNLKLSQKRAEAIKNYLVSKGIPADRFKVEWFGSKKPIADNKTETGRQKNRRVEMLIIE